MAVAATLSLAAGMACLNPRALLTLPLEQGNASWFVRPGNEERGTKVLLITHDKFYLFATT